MVLANQEILMAYVVRRNNRRRKQKTNENRKLEQQKRKLKEMQKSISEAIREQVSNKMAELLPYQISGLVVEAALKTSSKKKMKTNLAETLTKAPKNLRNCSRSKTGVCGRDFCFDKNR